MLSFYNIFTVARIEVKTLLRSWFFRIFSLIAVIFLGAWNFGSLSKFTHAPWAFRGIPSTIPYISLVILNSVQARLLSSGCSARDSRTACNALSHC